MNIEYTYQLTRDVFENEGKKPKKKNAFACSIIFAMNNLVIPSLF